MATYATYRHVELDRVGLGKKRVLKPPGGGSSISFGEDSDDYMKPKAKTTPAEEFPKEEPEQAPKLETNGMDTPEKDGAAATKESNPSTATNGSLTSGSSTPTSRVDTQSRLFGEEPPKEAQCRRVRDHQRSNIFGAEVNTNPNGTPNGSPRAVFSRTWTRRDPVTGVGVLYWDIHAPRYAPSKRKAGNPVSSETPETKTTEQPQPQQKQRIPPGGFSTKLW
ncbi:microtubule-associated protein Jupiter-like isoform X2 [Penaeus monodon]|uniref:microtubule-associated protein Jupiter-like isoform X2 n=1 Tax=Penaeus monodon TaxID=6687 RepID=UPI0018A78D4E|nr:microtubule-associated protein Jupiter-like isoform X2 [Penaeus monodon]